jgi:hypothetical protein
MEQVLMALLRRLEAIGDTHFELFDTDVREAMDDVITRGFLKPQAGYIPSATFAMFSDEGNRLVRETLVEFLPAARQAAAHQGLDTFRKRLVAFQNLEVRTEQKNDYNDFFGWSNPEGFDESGNVIRQR